MAGDPRDVSSTSSAAASAVAVNHQNDAAGGGSDDHKGDADHSEDVEDGDEWEARHQQAGGDAGEDSQHGAIESLGTGLRSKSQRASSLNSEHRCQHCDKVFAMALGLKVSQMCFFAGRICFVLLVCLR